MIERNIRYQSLSLPKFFIEEIKDHIEKQKVKKKNPRYSSITDFVKQAVRYRIQLDQATQLDKANLLLKELEDLKTSGRNIRKEIKYIDKHGTDEEKVYLKETRQALHQHMDAKLKKEDEWDREIFEYQLTHGASPYQLKETRKQLISKYKKQKKDIPDWLSDTTEEPTIQLSQSKFNEILQRIEKLEKKEKKKTS